MATLLALFSRTYIYLITLLARPPNPFHTTHRYARIGAYNSYYPETNQTITSPRFLVANAVRVNTNSPYSSHPALVMCTAATQVSCVCSLHAPSHAFHMHAVYFLDLRY